MLQVELQGLRSKALAEQRDHVVVLVNGDGTGCSLVNAKGCTRYFLLADPDPAAWSFAAFNPESPGTNVGAVLERETLNRVFLSLAAEGKAGPPPFASVKVFDPLYKHTCASALCVAFRFQANGDVFGEMPGGGTQKRGNAVALVTDLEGQTGGAEKRILLVGFPNGIIKTYPY
jgi:hypothetical protein